MKKTAQIIGLSFLLCRNFSCAEQKVPSSKAEKTTAVASSAQQPLRFSSAIMAIHRDRSGNYWLASHKEGVCRYNGKSVEYFTVDQGLADNQVRSIQEDQLGRIYFGTAQGVCRYEQGKIIRLVENSWEPALKEKDFGQFDLWFNADTKEGAYCYDGEKLSYWAFPLGDKRDVNNAYALTDFSRGKNGALYWATYAAAFIYEGQGVQRIDNETLGLKKEEGLHIRSILKDSKGRLWIGNNGIGVLLMQGDTVLNFSREKGLLMPMEAFRENTEKRAFTKNKGLQSVFLIVEDQKGNIWFSDRDTDLWRFDGKNIQNYKITENDAPSMPLSFYEEENGILLFGLSNGKVYQFDGQSFQERF
ncbi:two-component regulator propeller domain-containing protein [Saprospira sp. CCB-QB6]|uniref:ligand-binding sensor domain-containing protein n=1 Tax=Saprospira sp. CCB-QB6 TaxID=3023936 RepID=UPI00234B9162|nr:two-component regulator propeller domain-containing protein [Saprospira sp. CCB-QB6]WCL81399.1 two-component regulator propeller domain-containing protein [Saprospira sp. CCB-QB6]